MISVISSNNHWILSLKLLLLSSAMLSMAVVLKFSVPVVADILVSDVPAVWSSILSWLRPPYLYLLVNFIIITILASSKLHQDLVDPTPAVVSVSAPAAKLSDDSRADFIVRVAVADVRIKSASDEYENFAMDVPENYEKSDVELVCSRVSDRENQENGEKLDRSGLQKEDSVEISFQKYEKKPPISSKVGDRKAPKPTPPPAENKESGEKADRSGSQKDQDYSVEISSLQNYEKKPPISSKVGDRKAAKPTPPPAGKTSRGPHVTLDDTWKAITEGRTAPFSRRLDKSDTWESNGGRDETGVSRNGPPAPEVKKSETSFNGGGKNKESRQSAAAAVRKKPSLTEEELNRRVEAFIEKFKEEMRLQREESLKKFQKMISEGGY